jgi:hypothetical protein
LNIEEYKKHSREITDWDNQTYWKLVSTELTDSQKEDIITPPVIFNNVEVITALHWHPEIIPLDMARTRVNAMFPDKEKELIIPTQHNQILSYDGFSGVEVDCYSPEFNRKVQLLLHFKTSNVENAPVLKSILDHTFKYRSTQLFEIIDTIINPKFKDKIEKAVSKTGVGPEIVDYVTLYVKKLKMMIDQNFNGTPRVSMKNKLIPNYMLALKEFFEPHIIKKTIIFLKEVKKIVKKNFNLKYFYKTEEVIEEARSHNGGIIVPHPEQFWPILLADYDVDGYEVWNPQSLEFTDFLINVVVKKNKSAGNRERPLLVTMGDDTHLGEKLKAPENQDPEKASREIGLQPPWDYVDIQKSLILGNFNRETVINEYLERIA